VSDADWPVLSDLCAAVAERVDGLLSQTQGPLAEVLRTIMSSEERVLSAAPRPQSSILVAATAVSAGGTWRAALWPAVAMECVMAAADVFDDIADGEAADLSARFGPGVVLMGAAGLLTLGIGAVARGREDALPEATIVDQVRALTEELAQAADGQAKSLSRQRLTDATAAYELAALKSGPLGSLGARLGAMSVTANADLINLYGSYGWHLAVYSQLMNDARDAAPAGSQQKSDVREGRNTVPLVFASSTGAPSDLSGDALGEWEVQERQRVADVGGVLTAVALAQADRVHAIKVLEALIELGHPVELLRALLDSRT
jgi:geranylgeranyl pyrophosphate synthase